MEQIIIEDLSKINENIKEKQTKESFKGFQKKFTSTQSMGLSRWINATLAAKKNKLMEEAFDNLQSYQAIPFPKWEKSCSNYIKLIETSKSFDEQEAEIMTIIRCRIIDSKVICISEEEEKNYKDLREKLNNIEKRIILEDEVKNMVQSYYEKLTIDQKTWENTYEFYKKLAKEGNGIENNKIMKDFYKLLLSANILCENHKIISAKDLIESKNKKDNKTINTKTIEGIKEELQTTEEERAYFNTMQNLRNFEQAISESLGAREKSKDLENSQKKLDIIKNLLLKPIDLSSYEIIYTAYLDLLDTDLINTNWEEMKQVLIILLYKNISLTNNLEQVRLEDFKSNLRKKIASLGIPLFVTPDNGKEILSTINNILKSPLNYERWFECYKAYNVLLDSNYEDERMNWISKLILYSNIFYENKEEENIIKNLRNDLIEKINYSNRSR